MVRLRCPALGRTRHRKVAAGRGAARADRRRTACAPALLLLATSWDSALHPIIAQVERAAGFGRDDDLRLNSEKLDAVLSEVSVPTEDVSLIAELLGLGGVDRRYPRLDLAPLQRKQRTLKALRRWVEALSRQHLS